ncbi:UDP-glycosyltransferase 90A1-like [Primulina huaijiensis]|uniref:UDP-glycosyltransferase 90A1-like n=1 Tax=Primulina huaijiensis TaxID=1492673 RepID=UPI003CC70FBB
MGSLSCPHFAIFPFFSQGHTIPLLYLCRLLRRRSVVVTLFTTAGNSPRIRAFLQDIDVSIVELPFPQNIEGVPPGVENTDQLSYGSSFLPFVRATEQMQESFEKALETLQPPASCVVSDSFLWWTLKSAQKIGVPRLGFFGMGNFSATMYQILGRFSPHAGTDSVDEPFSMTDFPEIKLTRNDFEPPFGDINPSGPFVDFMMECIIALAMSNGLIVNSFYELESRYTDYWNKNLGPKAWNIGPLCLAAEPPENNISKNSSYLRWLDEKLDKGEPVLYVSFGTQAEISPEQFLEIAEGLEKSEVSFLWALRSKGLDFLPDFESRVKGRGLVAKEWVDQSKILQHDGVKGFLSHCGWNSVMESISAGVPILAMPFMAEQHLNARFVADEIGVGLRILSRDGSVRGYVEAEEVEMKARELMGCGKVAEEVSKRVAEWGRAAHDAMKEGGSSWLTLDLLIEGVMGKSTD